MFSECRVIVGFYFLSVFREHLNCWSNVKSTLHQESLVTRDPIYPIRKSWRKPKPKKSRRFLLKWWVIQALSVPNEVITHKDLNIVRFPLNSFLIQFWSPISPMVSTSDYEWMKETCGAPAQIPRDCETGQRLRSVLTHMSRNNINSEICLLN